MKIFMITMVVICTLTSMIFGQAGQVDTGLKATLINLEKQSWEAWKKRDGKFFETFLSDDHVEVGFGGVANKSSVVAFVGSPVCVVKSYELEGFNVSRINDAAALVTYHAAQDTNCNGSHVPSPVWVSSLYVKRGGRWYNVFYQQTQAEKKRNN
ncbi:MAG: nuclear transport factor 2 family protein [Acidobacteriota bacterium]